MDQANQECSPKSSSLVNVSSHVGTQEWVILLYTSVIVVKLPVSLNRLLGLGICLFRNNGITGLASIQTSSWDICILLGNAHVSANNADKNGRSGKNNSLTTPSV